MIAECSTSLKEKVKTILGEHLVMPCFEQCSNLFHGNFNVILASSEIIVLDGFIESLNSIFLLEMFRFKGHGFSGLFLGLDRLLIGLLLWVFCILMVIDICGNLIHFTYIIVKSI